MVSSKALIFLLGVVPVFAQQAVLRGTVTDESGALVAGARVAATAASGAVRNVASNGEGTYSFSGLAPGDYVIQASAPNLALAQPAAITLKPGSQLLNLQLKIATTMQQVTVRADASNAISTEASTNANAVVLQGDDLDALGDDPEDLLTDLQALAGPSAGPSGGSIFIDGFSGGELPPKSAIREIRINQNPFSPEYDRLGFGRIEIFTKPGTDTWHGSINYNVQNEFWQSRNPYAPVKAPLRLNEQEGGTSGSLNRRTSFTFDFGHEAVKNGSIVNAVTLDPQTLAPTPFSDIHVTPQVRTMLTPRVDYQLTPNNTLMFRYGYTNLDIQGAGIGSFDLTTRGYHSSATNQTVQATETAVLGTSINETRFQFFRSSITTAPNSPDPALLVLGSFNGGGAQTGLASNTQDNYELQNYTSMLRGAHSWRFGVRLRRQSLDSVMPQNFGGTFTFGGGLAPVLDGSGQEVQIQSIERYRRTLLYQQMGLPASEIRALGGGATQFTISAGQPGLALQQVDVGAYVGDDWRVRPNVTISLGLRYETQSNIHDWHDWAARIGIAWAPGRAARNSRQKTVLRAGFGLFYDRFALNNTLTAERYDGVRVRQYVVADPDFYPLIPSIASLDRAVSQQVVQEVSSSFRAPYLMQSALTLERQLPANTTLAVTYTNTHGLHQLRSEDINAPLPGTGVYPLGTSNPRFLMTSSALYNQNQLMFNVNSRINQNLSMYAFYVLNRAMSNSDGLGTFPANPYNFAGEYGPAATDVRNRVNLGGSINAPWHVRISPYINIQSGAPFDITAGSDLFGTTLFNGRPGIATNGNKPGLIRTTYGLLDPNPTEDETLLPRNYGRGPGLVTVNMRVGKTWGFGGEHRKQAAPAAAPTVPGAGPAPPGNGGGISGGVSATPRRYNVTLSLSVRNLTNHTNPGPIIGNITSPLFGLANQSAGSGGGSGISEAANNRRTEVQLRLQF